MWGLTVPTVTKCSWEFEKVTVLCAWGVHNLSKPAEKTTQQCIFQVIGMLVFYPKAVSSLPLWHASLPRQGLFCLVCLQSIHWPFYMFDLYRKHQKIPSYSVPRCLLHLCLLCFPPCAFWVLTIPLCSPHSLSCVQVPLRTADSLYKMLF